MRKHISIKSFRDAVKSQDVSALEKTVTADFQIKALDNGSDLFTFVITNDALDRANDIVDPDGLDVTEYLRNPRVLKIHNDGEWPIGRCVELKRVGNGWQGTVEFCPADYPVVGPDAEFCRRALKDGFISAVSIGFRPLNYSINDAGGMTITESELLEFSIVPIPCNQEALLVNVKEKQEDDAPDTEDSNHPDTSDNKASDILPEQKKKINRKRLQREIDLAKIKSRLK
ncbi:hypothetical protein HKD21_11465 [Gluconobacter cerevisiae]|uniref:Prohead serine protease domain-containing protein n=1 Tax=Gluconobacter cerevisiae TaxID=1379734 RepID=A0ABR9YFL8_9PROT|nr:HK97 family phage prohead protease [Gluconobacter cerevisiae]MBF0877461.1 hypothetical protein [Gluconobacter cerevisiae]